MAQLAVARFGLLLLHVPLQVGLLPRGVAHPALLASNRVVVHVVQLPFHVLVHSTREGGNTDRLFPKGLRNEGGDALRTVAVKIGGTVRVDVLGVKGATQSNETDRLVVPRQVFYDDVAALLDALTLSLSNRQRRLRIERGLVHDGVARLRLRVDGHESDPWR